MLVANTSEQVRVRSEHAIGYLKGRFQSLRGLRQQITTARDHNLAVDWVKTCVVIHTLVLRLEGMDEDEDFRDLCIAEGNDAEEVPPDAGNLPRHHHTSDDRRKAAGYALREELKQRLVESGVLG